MGLFGKQPPRPKRLSKNFFNSLRRPEWSPFSPLGILVSLRKVAVSLWKS